MANEAALAAPILSSSCGLLLLKSGVGALAAGQPSWLAKRDLEGSSKQHTVRAPNRVKAMTAILLAEDDPGICDLLTDVLEYDLTAMVRCERTGSLALRAIETSDFDLAIIDVNMPEVSGYELARSAVNRNIPALLSSGHSGTEAQLKEYEFPHLAKPYRIEELVEAASIAITQAAENIHRIKASLARLKATTEGLKAATAESDRLIKESKALLVRCTPPAPVTLDAVGEWLSRLASQSQRG
jgi:CheY-like chemotaxis protein